MDNNKIYNQRINNAVENSVEKADDSSKIKYERVRRVSKESNPEKSNSVISKSTSSLSNQLFKINRLSKATYVDSISPSKIAR